MQSALATQAQEMAAKHQKLAGSEALAQGWSSDMVLTLAVAVLVFAAFVIVLATILMWRMSSDHGQVLRCFGLIFLMALSTLLIVVGYSNEQLAPVIGLFGVIAGHLLSKSASGTKFPPKE